MDPLACLIFNCTLKRSPGVSNTQGLIDNFAAYIGTLNVQCETVRVVDYNVRFGSNSDEGGGDEWPQLLAKCLACDIFVIATPIWLGDRSSVAKMVAERLDATTYQTDRNHQHPMYGKVGGALVTGEADGAQHAMSQILYDMGIAGLSVPPNPDCYWVGGAGGPGQPHSKKGGDDYFFVNQRVRWMAHNLVHLAKTLKSNPYPTDLDALTKEAKSVSSQELP